MVHENIFARALYFIGRPTSLLFKQRKIWLVDSLNIIKIVATVAGAPAPTAPDPAGSVCIIEP